MYLHLYSIRCHHCTFCTALIKRTNEENTESVTDPCSLPSSSSGKPIIENITDAIYASRKTICVISRRYLESEWCSREIQVAR